MLSVTLITSFTELLFGVLLYSLELTALLLFISLSSVENILSIIAVAAHLIIASNIKFQNRFVLPRASFRFSTSASILPCFNSNMLLRYDRLNC